jgi:glucose-6-phosphate isomerase
MLMIGNTHFEEFLLGAHEMDTHFRHAAFSSNMPVLLALLSIWYTNFYGATAQAIIPYAYRLRYLIPYLQQASMESNGKSVANDGSQLSHQTCPIIFGEEGCNGQHTYHQLLHQGQHLIPADFILIGKTNKHAMNDHRSILLASGLSQAKALLYGKSIEEATTELVSRGVSDAEAEQLAKHQAIPGNRPSNILFIDRITPHSLGALIALYEHKIFVQSVIWDINPFDQWGVELGKQLLPDILRELQQEPPHDSMASNLIQHIREKEKAHE